MALLCHLVQLDAVRKFKRPKREPAGAKCGRKKLVRRAEVQDTQDALAMQWCANNKHWRN